MQPFGDVVRVIGEGPFKSVKVRKIIYETDDGRRGTDI